MKNNQVGEGGQPMTIDERTGISVKVLIALMGLVLTATIWVGTAQRVVETKMIRIETKLDLLATQFARSDGDLERLHAELQRHVSEATKSSSATESRLTILEDSGSKAAHELQNRVNDLEVRIRVLERGVKQ